MKTIKVPGMMCQNCVKRITNALSASGIEGKIELESKTVTVAEEKYAEVLELLDDLGFDAE